jgi:hypothetical protein
VRDAELRRERGVLLDRLRLLVIPAGRDLLAGDVDDVPPRRGDQAKAYAEEFDEAIRLPCLSARGASLRPPMRRRIGEVSAGATS